MRDMSLLVIGDSGTGKTKFLDSMQAAGEKVFIFDFDKGTIGLKLVPRDSIFMVKDQPYWPPTVKLPPIIPNSGIYAYGTGWTKFLEKMNQIGTQIQAGTWPYTVLAFDSITFLGQLDINFILKTDKDEGKNPHIGQWGQQIQHLITLMDQLTSWPGIKYVTAHVQRDENPITKITERLPLVTGKFAPRLPTFFDEVYFAVVKRVGEKPVHQFITHSDSVHVQARTRFEVPDDIIQDWKEVLKYLPKVA